jgi:hypothetical protein
MANKAPDAFDANFNMRCFEKDREEFYEACKTNGEPDGSKVVRRMMADYVEGNITYSVQHEES